MSTARASGSSSLDTDIRRRHVGQQDIIAPVSTVSAADEGKVRKQKPASFLETLDAYEYVLAPLIFTFLSFFTRMWKIGESNIVVWDEAHFGKFGHYYVNKTFYFDVHPPAGKLLVGLSGWLAGSNGSFEFPSGAVYPPELDYVFMRRFGATFGAVCVPLAYYTAAQLGFRRSTIYLITIMTLFETSLAAISRFILLDAMLLAGTYSTTLCWARLYSLRHREFSWDWYLWLCLSGLSIGFVCSVKWVGLFVTVTFGIFVAEDLWNKLADTDLPFFTYIKHVVTRVVGLILIPAMVYAASYKIHFMVLSKSGPGDAQMPSLFQANLQGSDVGKDVPMELAMGSRFTLKAQNYGGGLLHSHVQTYPEGSKQQQVTAYNHKDSNNDWILFANRGDRDYDPSSNETRFVGDGDVVRFIHASTGRNLHSHDIKSSVSKQDYEVSCYGNTTVGDTKDHWRIEVVKDAASSDRSRIRTLTTTFRLKHVDLGCYLQQRGNTLAAWGFRQQEISCGRSRGISSLWNLENHWNDKLPKGDPAAFKASFWDSMIHLNIGQSHSNNALIPDEDKFDGLASKWFDWIFATKGLRMCSWDDSVIKYYLLGSPAVYWTSTTAVGGLALLVLYYLVRFQRSYHDLKPAEIDHIHYAGLYPALGYVLHLVPFIIMSRVTYIHHYIPAAWFSVLVFGFMMDWLTRPLARKSKILEWAVYGFMYLVVIGTFIFFSPMVFGMKGKNTDYSYMKLLSSWTMTD